jgi:hypothetical protein
MMSVLLDLAGVGSFGRFLLCLEFAGSGGIRSCARMFYSDRLVLEEAARSSVLCCHQVTFGPWSSQR